MNRSVMTAVFVAAVSAAIAAQSGGTMKDAHTSAAKMSNMAADMIYTGCLQLGSAPGMFILSGADPTMRKSMEKAAKSTEGMSHNMMATTLVLTAPSVDLRKHVGQRVSVTGSSVPSGKDAMGKDQSTFTVKTLKTVAASCS